MKSMKLGIQYLILLSLFLCFSCAVAPTHGLFYTKVAYPGDFNSENDVLDKKAGSSCQVSFLGLITYGDISAGGVAREYAISKISSTDYVFTGIVYPAYGRLCIIVRGE
ncbi:MAG: TRL-like family protein [Leptospira sp.]|nr:TRL-like family protein [Leptospira sp.]NCS92750.1 TRL-like family protein [Leptospira sp.]